MTATDLSTSTVSERTAAHIETTERYAAHNYHPLPVVLAEGDGAWVVDVDGRRYLDCLAGYSALNFGHSNERLVAVAREQLGRLTLTSRAFFNDQLSTFAESLARLTGKDMILPMNSGAEAVETAIKVSRKWGYEVKGVPAGQASIVTMEGNFHGRTTTIVSFSDDEVATSGYAPFTSGFRRAAYGDIASVAAAIDDTTVAVLFEPIQGEGGVVMPPEGFLRDLRALCTERNVLMVADEIQSGLARSGRTFACDHEDVVPDIYVMGKALGGGHLPRLRDRGRPRGHGRHHPRLARLHLRRQPARRGHRHRGRRDARGGHLPGPCRRDRHADRGRLPPARRPRPRRRARPRRLGRHRHRPGADDAVARCPRRSWLAASWPRTPTARPSASPRRSSPATTTSRCWSPPSPRSSPPAEPRD